MPIISREEYDAKVEQARQAAAAYYDTGSIVMSDAEYDALIDEIEQAHGAHPEWPAQGLLDSVAGGQSAGGEVRHPSMMGSLEKAKDLDALDKFSETLTGVSTIEPKLDGLAVRAEYKAGQLVLVATRGDGMTGEDVTGQALAVSGLPATLPVDVDIELRGEVYMTDADFDASNSARVSTGKPAFANPRNAVAGSLRNTEREYNVTMSFAAYDVHPTGVLADNHLDTMRMLETWGARSAAGLAGFVHATSPSEIHAAIESLGERRDTLGYPIDGAVVKANSFQDRESLGMGTRAPRWAVAYKYAPNEATTTLKDIEVAVGRTGRISLRAVLEPVAVGGTTVTYATLHNPAFVETQRLAVGQRVLVVRAGDVIPRVTAAVGEQPEGLTPWQPPQGCPDCGEAWDKSSLLWRCATPECSTVGRITYACSRDALDIEGVSDAISTALVESGLVGDVADLFALTPEQIADVELGTTSTGGVRKVGPVVAAKIKSEIDKAKSQSLARVITALGIRKTGRTMSRRIAAAFGSMAAFRAASAEELSEVEGIGPEKARVIVEELQSLRVVIDKLAAAGVTMTSQASQAQDLPLAGETVVVTGAMTGPLAALSRNEMNELIEQNGGRASGSVSAKTSLVVSADDTTSKAAKARQLKIPVVSPDEFAKKIRFSR